MFGIKQPEAEIPTVAVKNKKSKNAKCANNQERPLDVDVVTVAKKRNHQKILEPPGQQKTTQLKNH